MKAISLGLILATLLLATPCLADRSLAGRNLFTVSHGQPFCTSRANLIALLRAQISDAPYGDAFARGCQYVSDNAIVAVDADIAPRGRYMHIVRARANVGFGTVDGYTFSVGLYRYPVREAPFELRLF